jgi:hypothetical protein
MRGLEAVYQDPVKGQMLAYVKQLLAPVDKLSKSGKRFPFRSRFGHTERVLAWALRLNAAEPFYGDYAAETEAIAVAAIFHDAGYSVQGDGHAKFSEEIFLDYAAAHRLYADWGQGPAGGAGTDGGGQAGAGGGAGPAGDWGAAASRRQAARRLVDRIAETIAIHSDKELENQVLTRAQQILMDADSLDEVGAIRFLWECFLEAGKEEYGFESAYDRLTVSLGKLRDLAPSKLHTGEGRRAAAAMLGYLEPFLAGLAWELHL